MTSPAKNEGARIERAAILRMFRFVISRVSELPPGSNENWLAELERLRDKIRERAKAVAKRKGGLGRR